MVAMVKQERQRESIEAALVRLAQQARDRGVRIVRDRNDGRHYATSVSQPGKLHFVTGYSCDCQGFQHHQRCMHHAALLAALGWLPGPAPEPPAAPAEAVECPYCWGDGVVGQEDKYICTCPRCHGAGTVTVEPAA